MSGDTKETTQTQQSATGPWQGAKPALKTALGDATDLYSAGIGFQPYTGSTVVPFADRTKAGMDNIGSMADEAMAGPNAFDRGYNFYDNLISSGGLNSDQSGVLDQWKNTASGAEMNTRSPEFDAALKRVQDDARTGVDLSMSASGRYGSGAHTDVLGETIGGVTDKMMMDNYLREQGRMDTARGNVANLAQQGVTNASGATAALPAAWTARQQPARDNMTIGSMYEDLAGRTMADQARIFQETQKAPLQAVEWLNAIASGAGSLGGTSSGTSTVQQPAPNPFLTIGATALGANSLLNNPLGNLFK